MHISLSGSLKHVATVQILFSLGMTLNPGNLTWCGVEGAGGHGPGICR